MIKSHNRHVHDSNPNCRLHFAFPEVTEISWLCGRLSACTVTGDVHTLMT